MTRPRRLLANTVAFALLAGSAAAIVTGKELWPFSPYPMFSAARTEPRVTKLWLYGILPGGGEAPLHDHRWFRPLRLSQLLAGVGRLPPEELRVALEDVHARYEDRRRSDLHRGPPFEGLRLYRMTFALDPDPAGRDRPLSRELLYEYRVEAR